MTTEDIKDFLNACDSMTSSKFILVDKRIGDVLKSIATTKPVYNAIAENMINFNFASAYKFATARNGEISIPEDKTIAFVFCLLKNIDNGGININELLSKHFPPDDKSGSYSIFCQKTIVPFKNQIVEKLCGTQKKARHRSSSTEEKRNRYQTHGAIGVLGKRCKVICVWGKKNSWLPNNKTTIPCFV